MSTFKSIMGIENDRTNPGTAFAEASDTRARQ